MFNTLLGRMYNNNNEDETQNKKAKGTDGNAVVPYTTPDPKETITHLTFCGRGTFTVTGDLVSCDQVIEVTKTGPNSLVFRGAPGSETSLGSFTVRGATASSIFSMGGGTRIENSGSGTTIRTNGLVLEVLNDGDLKIEGTLYKRRKPAGSTKIVYLPEGHERLVGGPITAEEESRIKQEEEEEAKARELKKKYVFGHATLCVGEIALSGQTHVIIDRSILDAEYLVVDASGQSSLGFSGTARIDRCSVSTSGQSSFKGLMEVKASTLGASGQSSIRGIHSTLACTASSSGQASISVTADRTAAVSSTYSGQSYARITKQ